MVAPRRIVAFPIAVLAGASLLAPSCDDAGGKDDCGECAALSGGGWEASGDPRLDGVFRAAVELDGRLRGIEGRTREAVGRLADAFGVTIDPAAAVDDNAAAVAGAAFGVFADSVEWSDWHVGPTAADSRAAYAAHAACLTHFGCAVDAGCAAAADGSGPVPPVTCEGDCAGACSGACEGLCLSAIEDGECDGTCFGACQLVAPAQCGGSCYGNCSGANYVNSGNGNVGPCDFSCEGICVSPHLGMGSCDGCTGACGVESSGACAGECRGACAAECTGGCSGRPTPRRCTDDACAEADACRDVAGLLGVTGLRATWSEYLVVWYYSGEADSATDAEIAVLMAAVEDEMRALIAANAELKALFSGDGAGGLSAVEALTAELGENVSGGFGSYEIPDGRGPCVTAALEELADLLAAFAARVQPTLQAQANLLAILDQ